MFAELVDLFDRGRASVVGEGRRAFAVEYEEVRLFALFEAADTSYLLTCPATMKTEDMLKQWRHYDQFVKVNSLIVTKLDESQSIGSFLTFAYEAGLPISFCTNGQGVPEDLKKASTLVLMEYLDGFDLHIRPIIGQLT